MVFRAVPKMVDFGDFYPLNTRNHVKFRKMLFFSGAQKEKPQRGEDAPPLCGFLHRF